MRDYTKVSPNIWNSKKFWDLKSDQARLAYLYLLTNQHQTSAGAYRLPKAYAAHDLKWNANQFEEIFQEICAAGLVEFDEDTEELLIVNWLEFNPPMNPKHYLGITRTLERLSSERLQEIGIGILENAYPSQEQNGNDSKSKGRLKRPSEMSGAELVAARKNGHVHQ